jgi:YggT family protein
VNLFLCDVAQALGYVVWLYTGVLLVYAVISWFPDLRRGRWAYYLASLVEPVLMPVRRIIPPVGGFDVAFLVVLLLLQLLIRPALAQFAFNSCVQLY